MWKKWSYYNGQQSLHIGQPTLVDTTVEEGYLETIPEVDSLKSKRSSINTQIPEQPLSVPSFQRTQQMYRAPAWSQPSPTLSDSRNYQFQQSYNASDLVVSPPTSPPPPQGNSLFEETPISPIEPELPPRARPPLSSKDYPSRIPQRVTTGSSGSNNVAAKQKKETRWDVYSGEPTKDDSGRPATVRPGVQPLEHQYPQLKERTKQILAGLRERDSVLQRPSWEKEPPPAHDADPLDNVVRRMPWKGASGRDALVDPVQNTPSARTKTMHNPQQEIPEAQQSDPVEFAKSPSYTLRTVASEESIKPVAPLKIATKSRNPSPQSSQQSQSPSSYETIHSAPPVYQAPKTLQSPFSSPGPVQNMEGTTPLSSARMESPQNDMAPETPKTPTPPGPYEDSLAAKMRPTYIEPDISRFSWTTYSTSVTESPGSMARIIREESPPPPMPPMPKLLIKKRPVSGTHSNNPYLNRDAQQSHGSVVIRKPVGSKSRPSTNTIGSRLSLSKTLPQVPPAVEAADKISNLEAQLAALAMRKHNTTRIIRDLNESLKKNAIVYDLWKRKEVATRIANHESELQCIFSEEHEISLRLHRAQKKRDKDDNYELPTGLWIKRVTS